MAAVGVRSHGLPIAQHLAVWGAAVEVVEPVSVRAELARIGAELAARYPT